MASRSKYKIIKSIINAILNRFGLNIVRVKSTVEPPWVNEHMLKGLLRLKKVDLDIQTIVDVGAAAGSWTVMAKDIWPGCAYVLFEPLEERQKELKTLASSLDNVFIVPYAAGKTISETKFYVSDDLDGSGIVGEDINASNVRIVKQTTIGIELNKFNLKGPYLIKLDTHGYEIPIIEGCGEIINDVTGFIIECYGFQIAENALMFWEMCRYMDNVGFRLFDIVDIMNRSVDGAFWQCDAFFIRKDNSIFETAGYI
jgi:FkbM family methyltransferase